MIYRNYLKIFRPIKNRAEVEIKATIDVNYCHKKSNKSGLIVSDHSVKIYKDFISGIYPSSKLL
jgi:hypothetical protein